MAEIADAAAGDGGTLRVQLKTLLHKTGTRQGEMVRLLMSLPRRDGGPLIY